MTLMDGVINYIKKLGVWEHVARERRGYMHKILMLFWKLFVISIVKNLFTRGSYAHS